MIRIKRDNEKVVLLFDTGLPHDCEGKTTVAWDFTVTTPAPYYAQLVTDYYRDRLRSEMQRIRREAYEEGWADAKAKRKKQDWFSGSL